MHTPVLLNEVIKILDPKPGEFFIDGTIGGAGHAIEIFKRIFPEGRLLGIDWNKEMLEIARTKISAEAQNKAKLFLVNGNYADLPKILKSNGLSEADGLLLDLGVSSDELESSGRGFSFEKDEPLLMTYSDETKPVKEILKEISENDLQKIIKDFSQERYARQIAKAIKEKEKIVPIGTSRSLALVIESAVPRNYERGRIHPATRTFMALRIYANSELENLENVLKHLNKILKHNGRVAVISFHSLEDRIVKNYFREMAKKGEAQLITKKPIVSSKREIAINPRSRSAKLRGIIRE